MCQYYKKIITLFGHHLHNNFRLNLLFFFFRSIPEIISEKLFEITFCHIRALVLTTMLFISAQEMTHVGYYTWKNMNEEETAGLNQDNVVRHQGVISRDLVRCLKIIHDKCCG